MRENVLHLHDYYIRRAQRQQTFLDTGALITFIGAAGAFEGNISTATRETWAIAAFTPSIISQFNAYEPTRELYHGGAIAVRLITSRYDKISRSLVLIGSLNDQDCTSIESTLKAIEAERSTAPMRYDPEGVLLAEARRMRSACLALSARTNSMRFMVEHASGLHDVLQQDFAADVIALDQALLAKDRDFRYTPIETLAAIVTSPLRAADFAITGENTKSAVDALKTQIAFSGMNRSLASVPLPALGGEGVVPTIAPLSDGAAALAGTSAPDAIKAHVDSLRIAGISLRQRQQQQAFQESIARDLVSAAGADYLTFTFDAVTRTTTVELGKKPPLTALVSASTGAPSQ